MSTNPVPNPELLREVEEAFSKYLNESGGQRRHWPEALQRLAVRAVTEGHSPRVVAKATKVSRGSVVNWCKSERFDPKSRLTSPAVELKVVESRVQHEAPSESSDPAVARILFLSGAILECPVSALTAAILCALNEARG
jgi:hypothetical protein